MKFLADENIALAVVSFLRKQGHDVASITEISPGSSDASVLLKAEEEQRILVTSDTDFGELVYRGYRNDHTNPKEVISLFYET